MRTRTCAQQSERAVLVSGPMVKKSAKMLGIKKMMAGGAGAAPQPPQKRDRPAKKPSACQQGESGDVLDDNFMAEEVAHGEGSADALDGGSSGADSDGEDADRAAVSKKRKHEALKERKKALKAPRREDSAAISSASAEGKAAFFLVKKLVAAASHVRVAE